MSEWTQHSARVGDLTRRQREVLELMASGRTNPEIARELGMSLAGAKWHVSEVISKLGVETREEAAELWRQEHTLRRRFRVPLQALTSATAVKVGSASLGIGSMVALAVGAFGLAASLTRQDDDQPQSSPGHAGESPSIVALAATNSPKDAVTAAPAEFPNAIFTRAEAEAIGRASVSDAIEQNGLQSATVGGKPLKAEEVPLVDIRFLEHATQADIAHLPGNSLADGVDRNAWLLKFSISGMESEHGGTALTVQVLFVDGTGTKLDGWQEIPGHRPPDAFPRPERVIGSVELPGMRWDLAIGRFEGEWYSALMWPSGQGYSIYGLDTPLAPSAARPHLLHARVEAHRGYTVVYGAVTSAVTSVQFTISESQSVRISPQPLAEGSNFPYRMFAWASEGLLTVETVRAFDADNRELGRLTPTKGGR